MASEVGGPNPIGGSRGARGSQGADVDKFQKQMRKIEEVEKVSEVEFEKKGRRFQKKEEPQKQTKASGPSPFETAFYQTPSAPVGYAELEEPSPDRMTADAPPQPPEENLPESEKFYGGLDLPDAPPSNATFQEEHEKNVAKKDERGKKLIPETRKEKPLYVEKRDEKNEIPIARKQPEASPFSGVKKKEVASVTTPHGVSFPGAEKKEKKQHVQIPETFEKVAVKKTVKKPTYEKEEETAISLPSAEDKGVTITRKGKEEKKDEPVKGAPMVAAVISPPDPLPQQCIQVAHVAQISATPFLNAVTTALFVQMVGTIVYIASAKPGVSLTEVTLNSPKMANSIFYNSVIQIEKYATAPNSFNIRLIGSPEAVQAFSQNIEGLSSAFTNAFEDKRIAFRVGRLETELFSEKPLVKRKTMEDEKERGAS